MANFTFDKRNKIIEVDLPDTEITIQELLNAIRDYEDEQLILEIGQIAEASGKEDLGGGVLVGITLKLLSGWKLRFAARPGPDWVTCRVSGGNLVALNDDNDTFVNPIADSAYVIVVISTSASPTIQELEIEELNYRIESLRGRYGTYGDPIWWDPINGLDTNNGQSSDEAKQTWEGITSAIGTDRDRVIFCMASNTTGNTIVSANIVISANPGLALRGNSNFVLTPETTGQPIISIYSNNFSIDGLQISGSTSGDVDEFGIYLSGINSFHFNDVEMTNIDKCAICAVDSDHGEIEGVHIHNCNCNGIIFNGVADSTIKDCYINRNAGHGIILTGDTYDNSIDKCYILNNDKYGIILGSGTSGAGVRNILLGYDNEIRGNTSGTISNENSYNFSNIWIFKKGLIVFADQIVSAGINWIQFSDEATDVGGLYDPGTISIVDGTGEGQTRLILEYNSTSKKAWVDRDWKQMPDSTSRIAIGPNGYIPHVNEGVSISGGSGYTFWFNGAASDDDNTYNGQIVFIKSGPGQDQARLVATYDGAAHSGTLFTPWDVNPVGGESCYVVIPYGLTNLTNAYQGFALSAGSNWIQFNTDASDLDGAYDPSQVTIVDGAGVGQTRQIFEYWGSAGDPRSVLSGMERVAWLDRNWKQLPDNTSQIVIDKAGYYPHVNEGVCISSSSGTTFYFNILASDDNNIYNGQVVFIKSGPGEDQARLVTTYDGSAHSGTVSDPWIVNPSGGSSVYCVIPYGLAQIEAFNSDTSADLYNITLSGLSGYRTSGVAGIIDLSAVSGSVDQSGVSAAALYALSAYESTGVASKADLASITVTGVTVDENAIASAVSGAIVSGIGAWGDLRWSKVYGVPLSEWDVLVMPEEP